MNNYSFWACQTMSFGQNHMIKYILESQDNLVLGKIFFMAMNYIYVAYQSNHSKACKYLASFLSHCNRSMKQQCQIVTVFSN